MNTPSMKTLVTAAALLFAAPALAGDALPGHPRDIAYPDLTFAPPKVADHRIVLPNGIPCYLVPDRAIPTLHVEVRIKAGEVFVGKEKRGLAKLVGTLMRDGGAGKLDSRQVDQALDRIAAEMSCSLGADHGEATLWTLSSHQDEALALLVDALRRPAFDADRIRRAKDDLKDDVAHRDDDPQSLLGRKFADAIYGDHPVAWIETEKTIDSITRDDIVAFWKRAVRPETLIISVAGDFDRKEMEKKLAALFGDWKGEGEALPAAVPPSPRRRTPRSSSSTRR
jgi:zinc protease